MNIKKIFRLRTVVPVLIVLAATAAVVMIATMPPKAKITPPVERTGINVKVLHVQPEGEVIDRFELPAVVEADRTVRVAAEVSGRIERILVVEGSTCKEGDLLVELNGDLLKAEFDSAAAQEKNNSLKYNRTRNLHSQGSSTDRDRDQAEAEMLMSKAARDAAYARLVRSKIVAPIPGILNSIPIEKGEYVQPGATVAEIVDIDIVKVVLQVPERDVHFINCADSVGIIASVRGEENELYGNITYISELADSVTRATRVEVTVENSRRLLRSGHLVRAVLTRNVLKDAVMVPLSAVIPLEGSKCVYVVNGDKAERRDVLLGIIKGRDVQIREGLAAGDKLIVAGHRFVAPGSLVKVQHEDGGSL
ncbi:MAG TPA: efflux RND transporter periplasmic adaptor subunit [Planctomycetota bacterium]|nr:efflux RND transporter periplasmic adaptor subunit [Planctomycetota bacterium]